MTRTRKRLAAAIGVAAAICLNAAAVFADGYVPVATGGEKKVVSYSLSEDGATLSMVVTHTFTNAAEVESLVFNRAIAADVLVVGGGAGGNVHRKGSADGGSPKGAVPRGFGIQSIRNGCRP